MMNPSLSTYQVRGMDCPSCARGIEDAVRRLPGVENCEMHFGSETLEVEGKVADRAVQRCVRRLGYQIAEPEAARPEMPRHFLHFLLARASGRMAVAGALFILPGLIWTEILARESAVVDAFSLMALVIAGFPVARSAFRAIAYNREININVLMTVAAGGAVLIGAFTEAGMVMVLFAIGEALEGYTAGRARESIRKLLEVAPDRALKIDAGSIFAEPVETPVEDLRIGDRVLVKPGDRVPMDGRVLSGASFVNQAPITGESTLVEKLPESEVFAGSVNGDGTLTIEVTKPAAETTLARMIRLVERSRDRQAPAQRFVDRFARSYTPVVMVLAIGVAALPPLLFGLPFWNPEPEVHGWLYRGLALLVVACPCALVISTPVSIISAITQAASRGILFKGGASLEALSQVRAVAFDKTGTLTEGMPAVVQVKSVACEDGSEDCASCNDLVALVSAVERHSEHPLARAVVTESVLRGVDCKYPPADRVTALRGQGVTGKVNGKQVHIGSHRFFDSGIPHHETHCNAAGKAADQGWTPVLVSAEGQYLGFLSVADTIRATSREALDALKRLGLASLVMLTGDNPGTARRVAEELGLSEVLSELLPEKKVDAVRDLEKRHGRVAMVGDGINDAPALASATVGIAMSGATAQAMESADITLMGSDLRRLPFAIRLARRTMRVIQANVALAIGIKVAFLGLVLTGSGTMWMAVLADVGTSLVVTLNGMRLLRTKG